MVFSKLKRIAVFPAALVVGLINAIVGLILGIIGFFVALFLSRNPDIAQFLLQSGLSGAFDIPVKSALLLAALYPITGFISGFIAAFVFAWLYNLIATKLPLKIELK